MLPTRRWLIAAYYDNQTNIKQVEQDICGDLDKFKGYSMTQPFPYDLTLDFLWFDIASIGLKGNKDDYNFYLNYNGIVPVMTEKYATVGSYIGLVLLLDRDLLIRNAINDLYVPIIKLDFFKAKKHPFNFVCCFGGTPKDGMRCDVLPESNLVCQIRAHGCTTCEPNEKLALCNHTCYWFLIGLLLGAYKKPKQSNAHSNEEIRKALPLPYIYT